MIRGPPRSTQSRSSAASDVYKRQAVENTLADHAPRRMVGLAESREEAQQSLLARGLDGSPEIAAALVGSRWQEHPGSGEGATDDFAHLHLGGVALGLDSLARLDALLGVGHRPGVD